MKHTLHRDYETRSPVDLRKAGAYVYLAHPDTDVWCCAYSVDDGPVKLWTPGDPVPPEFVECARNPDWTAVAHNDAFERLVERYIMRPRYGWPEIPLERHRCTMVMAYAMSLPGSLEDMLAALGTDAQKDAAGRRLMLTMSQPRRPRKGEAPGLYWWDDAERRERLYAYCRSDIVGERAGGDRLVRLRPSEQRLWALDQVINDRGVYVDHELCVKAKAVVAHVAKKLDREMAIATDWAVSGCSSINDLKTFVRSHGVDTDALDREAVEELLSRQDLPAPVRRPLELRGEAAKASVAKIDSLLKGMSEDGRARGLMQFHAASTGRWAGRRFQPQNIKRPEIKDVDGAIDILLNHDPARAAALLEMLYGPPLSVIGDCLRGMIRAPDGKKLLVADFSNIEGRVLAWLAGEAWKMDAFRAYDRGDGPDLYLVTAAEILGIDVKTLNKHSPERQAYGKVPELACGYQGGVGAFQTMAHTYRVTIEDEVAQRIVKGWRAKHANVVSYWYALEEAAFEAVAHPGTVTTVRDTKFKVVGSFLWCQLPSGRALCYPYPETKWKKMPWGREEVVHCASLAIAQAEYGDDLLNYVEETGVAVVRIPQWKEVVSYKGVNSYTRKWETIYTYGGKLAENIDQATARDILAEALVRVEAAGYPVVLHVHDELVCEVDEDFGSADEFEHLMTQLPPWADGLPVAAEAWSGPRYRKG